MRPSRRCPKGHVNRWPARDYEAFVALVTAAEKRMAERGEEDDIRAVQLAARELGLGRNHWLVREVLAGVYGRFALWGGAFYAVSGEAFFRNARPEDISQLGPDTLEWARTLAAREADEGSLARPSPAR